MNTDISALIVDDEQLARDLIRLHLSRDNHVDIVGECNNGFEALDLILRKQPDVVFLDIQMPGLTGFEMIERYAVNYFYHGLRRICRGCF